MTFVFEVYTSFFLMSAIAQVPQASTFMPILWMWNLRFQMAWFIQCHEVGKVLAPMAVLINRPHTL